MARGPSVEFGDVFVVRETETALLCRIGDKFHWVVHSRLQPGSTVEHPGDLGVLVLAWDFAVEFWDGAMSDPSFETHRIVNLSHRIGLWWQLPPDLRAYLADLAPLDPNVLYPVRPYPRETRHEHTRPWSRRHRTRNGSNA